MSAAHIRVLPVSGPTDRRDFLDLPGRLHRAAGTAAHHVPLLRAEERQWLHGRGWFPEPVTCLLAREAETDGGMRGAQGRVVGRIIVHHSAAFDAKLGARAQLFGALEAESAAAARALIRAAADEGRAQGREVLFGPVSPLPNVTGGALTSGFSHPGFFDTVWTPPFLAEALEAEGLRRWGEAHTWEVAVADIPARLRRPPTAHELEQAGVRLIRPRHYPGWLSRTLRPALNASFAQLPYYTEIGPAQMAAQTAGAELLMDPSLVVLLAEAEPARGGARQGTPQSADPRQIASFALVLPDPVDVLRAHAGRLGLRAARDLLRLRRPGRPARERNAVLIVQGTRPEHQGRGLLSLCVRQLYAALHAGGYTHLKVTFIAEDNPASAAVFARAGGRRLHGLAFFSADLGTP